MNIPKVSILIPLYNSEEYIAETIDSCLNQTYENIEIIIVDDGSTDFGLDIARQYEIKYENIKVYVQNNSGAPVARNRAFELSTGEYIQYIDADDLLHPDKIYIQMEVLKKSDDRTLAFGRYGYFKENIENTEWKDHFINKNYDNSRQFLIDLWGSGVAVIPHMWLSPRQLIEESGGWDESLAKNQDGEFFARVVFNAVKILFIENSIGYYRRDNINSISKQVSRKALSSALKSYNSYELLMKDQLEDPEVRRALASLYSQFIYRTYPAYQDLIEEANKKVRSFGFEKPIMKIKKYEYFLSRFIGIYNVLRLKRFSQEILKYKQS